MEENKINSKKINSNIIIYGVIIAVLFLAGIAIAIYTIKSQNERITSTQAELDANRLDKTSCISLRDSLLRENKRLYVYKSLTQAMIHRDEAVKQLKYGVGSVVVLKVDSSRVVIEDVVIGGSKYSYYIQYSVIHKDRTKELVSPDLIF